MIVARLPVKVLVQGFKNTADMIVHPVQTVQGLGHAAAHAGRCLGKVLNVLITEHDLCFTDPEEFARIWKSRVGKIQTVLVALEDKWHITPTRDIVKGVSAIGTEMVLMNELAAVTGKFLTEARNKALQFAENFEREAEVVLAMTAEGIPLEVRVAEEATMHFMEGAEQRIAAGMTHLPVEELALAVKQVVNLEPDLERLRKLFDMTRKGFGEMANKYIKLAYEHYLGPEFKNGTLKGLHHDLNNTLEKSGLVKIMNKVIDKNGVYEGVVQWNGKLTNKTFFPAHWTRQKVIEKIIEGYDNFTITTANCILEQNGVYRIESFTNCGVKIRMHITKSGHITTAFPLMG